MGKGRRLTWVLAALAVLVVVLLSILAYRWGQGWAGRYARPASAPLIAAADTGTPPGNTLLPASTPTPRASATLPPTQTHTPAPTATPTVTPSPTPTAIITALPAMPQGFLVTVSQPVQVTKTYDSAPSWWPKFPPFNLVSGRFTIVAYSQVSAGIDFARVTPADVIRRGDAVTVTLPGPELYGRPVIDPSQSYIIEQPGISSRDLGRVLAAQADLQGVVEQWAVEHGILTTARDAGQQMIELWFRRLGFNNVTLQWDYNRSDSR